MGGAEKMIFKLANFIKRHEDVVVINMNQSIANIYGKAVLKRKFNDRMSESDKDTPIPRMKIALKDFIPFSNGWRELRKQFVSARLIYIKYELLEMFLLSYFGGLKVYKKTIASLHTPLLYGTPHTFTDRLHKMVYASSFNQTILNAMKKIHVLNKRDEQYLITHYKLKNVIRIPNSLPIVNLNEAVLVTDKSKLFILFVGELSLRKGVDIVIELIKKLPDNYVFFIAGDGPMLNRLQTDCHGKLNYIYHGFIEGEKLQMLYLKSDVLLAPSRAEGLSLVMLEALSHGLKVVGYDTILSDFSSIAKSSSQNNLTSEYEQVFKQMLHEKMENKSVNTKKTIKKYFQENFSDEKILPEMQRKIFTLNL